MSGKSNHTSALKPIHVILGACIIGIVIVGAGLLHSVQGIKKTANKFGAVEISSESSVSANITQETESESNSNNSIVKYPEKSDSLKNIDDSLILAKSAVLIDINDNKIIAERNPDKKIYPASMTKIMALIVAAENIDDLNQTYTFSSEMINNLEAQDAAMAGFEADETVKIKDLMYGCGIASGADATEALADIVAGSETAFVDLMNQKAKQLGLKNTSFTNSTGLHDENHYSTVTDVALIMEYAMQNETIKEVLSTYEYTTDATNIHPNGLYMESTVFSKMYGTECEGITIKDGKTGFTDEAGYCLASYATDDNKKPYVCVVAQSEGEKGAVFDTLNMYGTITGGYNKPTTTPPATTAQETTTTTVPNNNAENQVQKTYTYTYTVYEYVEPQNQPEENNNNTSNQEGQEVQDQNDNNPENENVNSESQQ